jgi:hypothetical protein
MNIYIVANSKALPLLESNNIQNAMNEKLTPSYGHTVRTTLLDATTSYANNIDKSLAYKDIPTPNQSHQTTTIIYTKARHIKWDPKDFLYIDGSEVKGNNTLKAGVVNPITHIITHIDIKITTKKAHEQQSRASKPSSWPSNRKT